MGAEVLERRDARRLVPLRVEVEPVLGPDPPIRVGPELRPRPREREVDVEEDGLQHAASIGATADGDEPEPEPEIATRNPGARLKPGTRQRTATRNPGARLKPGTRRRTAAARHRRTARRAG